ncbi:SMEK domain-containing protein [Flavobacterium sp.]|uniref:SMEK domain-containing protein n=1 Tax=Flavobacterium sp. TaxID=239 RepID=UPI0031D78CB1
MTDHQKRNEVHTLLSFLKTHIQIYVENSFTDLTFDLEKLITSYLNVFEKSEDKYINANSLKHNYPAIDLISLKKSVAIQITTNADKKKVDKTIATYKKHSLQFKHLIIIGFVKATKSKIAGANVYGISYLTDLAKHADSNQLDELFEILKRQIPWNSLTPLDDKHCFDVIFDVINRSAIRDYTICEGSFERMAEGLDEVKEIITTGKIKDKNIRAKALVEFNDKIKRKMQEIEFQVSTILQICNLNKNKRQSDFLCLSSDETDEIDNLKEKIIKGTNLLAKELGLTKKIEGSRRT